MESSVLDLFRQWGHDDSQLVHGIEELSGRWGDVVFQKALLELVGKEFDPERARHYWEGSFAHRKNCSTSPERCRLRPALLNYLHQEARELRDPRIVEAEELASIRQAAITDGLTGLYQQTYFKTCLEKEVARERRLPERGLAVVLFDLDRFKQYNDRCGHLAGDSALQLVGSAIRGGIREGDVAARYGGEEFALLLTGVKSSQAFQIADRIRQAIEQTEFPQQHVLEGGNLTISGGFAVFPGHGETALELLEAADRQLYRAKKLRNAICPLHPEKRRSQRHPARTILELAPAGEGFQFGLSFDISRQGLQAGCSVEFVPGSIIDLKFSQPFWPLDLQLQGVVRHVRREEGSGLVHLGLQFVQAGQ